MSQPTAAAPRWRLPLLVLVLAGLFAWSQLRPPAADDAPVRRRADPARMPAAAPGSAPVGTGPSLPTDAAVPAASPEPAPRWRPALTAEVASGLFGAARPAPAAAPAAPASAAPVAAPAEPAAPAAAPLPAWQALGVLRERGQAPQALLQVDGQVLVLRPGDPVAAGWRLEAISTTHLELLRTDGTQALRLPVLPGD